MSTVLMTSVTQSPEESQNGFTVTRIAVSGDPIQSLVVGAVVEAYPHHYPMPTIDWAHLAASKAKVAVLRSGSNMLGAEMITADEGTIFTGRDGGPALLPKGKRKNGYRLPADKLLDMTTGYGTGELSARLSSVQSSLPALSPLTADDFRTLPTHGGTCKLAVMGRYGFERDNLTHLAVWLLHTYLPSDDICEGVLYLPGNVGFSEHGSIYGRQLLSLAGKVEGFTPVPLVTAMEWIDIPHMEMLKRVGKRGERG